ncbi:hypothetical protein RCL1_003434 [Eukaryota sp. TZLM3-RCL]
MNLNDFYQYKETNARLFEAFREATSKSDPELSDVSSIITLDFSKNMRPMLRVLDGIQCALNLETLIVGSESFSTYVSDLSPIVSLSLLKSLDLRLTKVLDISSLSKLSNLEQLVLDDTEVFNISPLSNLSSLKYLSLYRTSVFDLTPLFQLKELNYLNTDRCHLLPNKFQKEYNAHRSGHIAELLQDFNSVDTIISKHFRNQILITNILACSPPKVPISRDLFTQLRVLDMSNTSLASVQGLQFATGLIELNISNTGVTDFGPIGVVVSLEILDISRTKVTLLSDLRRLVNLRVLNCSHCPIYSLSCSVSNFLLLESLNVSDTDIDVDDLRELKNCTELSFVNVRECRSLSSLYRRAGANGIVEDRENVLDTFGRLW